MTQRIEPFFEYDSKNWKIFMIFWLKELNLFWIWLENVNFSWMWLTELNFFYRLKEMSFFFQNDKDFVEYDSKNRTFVWICPKELNLFWNFTQWIEHFCTKGLKELDPKRLFEQQNLLMNWWIGPFFSIWLKELILFSQKYHSKIIDLFWHDSQNWTPF